jgi:hypothetical protein
MKKTEKIKIERIFDEKSGKTLQEIMENAIKIIIQRQNEI